MEFIKALVFKLILASILYCISTSASLASFENCNLQPASGEDLVLLNRSSGEGDSFGYMKCGSRYFGKVHEVGVQYCFFNSYTINDAEVLKEGSFLGYDSDCEGYDGDSLLLFKGFKPKQTREIIGEIFHYWVFLSDQRYKFLLENVGWFVSVQLTTPSLSTSQFL